MLLLVLLEDFYLKRLWHKRICEQQGTNHIKLK